MAEELNAEEREMDNPTTQDIAAQKTEKFGRNRFSPGAYSLDLGAAQGVPVQMNGQPSTFSGVYCKLRDSKIKETQEHILGSDTYITEQGEIHLDGEIAEWPQRSTMRALANLLRQGINPHECSWFYYAHDWSRDADEMHTFFVVHQGKVIVEACNFSTEEPLVLKRKVDDDPIWHSHPYFDEAFEIYWYRKFYTETTTGQLMALRPDEPLLYHFKRPQTRDIEREIELATQVKIYRLLLVALPLLAAIVFPAFKDYLVGAAIGLGISFLWFLWETRKMGQP
jgi:hypothetical protein